MTEKKFFRFYTKLRIDFVSDFEEQGKQSRAEAFCDSKSGAAMFSRSDGLTKAFCFDIIHDKMNENFNKIIALMFAKGEPIFYSEMAKVLEMPKEAVINLVHLAKNSLSTLPFDIYIFKDRAQLILKEEYSDLAQDLTVPKVIKPFSKAVQETLAIIAYKQPITKQMISKVRGIECSHSVAKLLEYELIEVAGTLDVPRSPKLYRTTDEFLRVYGLSSIDDLPQLEQYSEIAELNMEDRAV